LHEFNQLLNQRERQCNLENSIVPKLQQHVERIQTENRNLQHELAKQNAADYSSPNQQQQIQQLTSVINELAPKNKELALLSEQQRAEIEAQNSTLVEQRSHIDVLEKALTNAQERISARERQVMDAAGVADKCTHLQKLLDEAVRENQQARDEWSRQQAAMQISVDAAQQAIQSTHLVSELNPFLPLRSPLNLFNYYSKDLPNVPMRKHSAPTFASHATIVEGDETLEEYKASIYAKDEKIRMLEEKLLEMQRHYTEEQRRWIDELERVRGSESSL